MRIISDTASLFSPEEGRNAGARIVAACTIHNDVVYRDYEDMTSEAFMELINSGAVPTSSQPAVGELIEAFEESDEETLALFIGDGLSGGYQTAVGAKNSLENGEHIRIIDTKTLAGAEHYLVQKAIRLRDEGLDIDSIEKELQKSIETSASYVIPVDFNFLKRSGRLTPIAAALGNMVKIVPVLTQTADKRRIDPFAVKRSKRTATEAIVKQYQKLGVDENYVIYICHGGDLEFANNVLKQFKEQFPKTDIVFKYLSPSMITHGGPGCVLVQTIRK